MTDPFTLLKRWSLAHLTMVGSRARSANAPIGVFDSGVGGLSVLEALVQALPNERFLYLADQAHVPYGGRPLDEIKGLATSITAHLSVAGAKSVVMACNISSATALADCREALGPGRVTGVIEIAARSVLARKVEGPVGVLATLGTVQSGAYEQQIRALAPERAVVQIACPRFVPLIEEGLADSPMAERAAGEAVDGLLARGVSTAILGCTHYPFMLPALEKAAAGRVRFHDPSRALASAVRETLEREGQLSPERGRSRVILATTGDPARFAEQVARLTPKISADIVGLSWAAETPGA